MNPTVSAETGICVFSTKDINALFSDKGYGKKFWDYGSPVTIYPNADGTRMSFQRGSGDTHYLLDESGDLKQVARKAAGVFLSAADDPAIAVYTGEKLLLAGGRQLPRQQNEGRSIIDITDKYLGRIFMENDAQGHPVYRFEVWSIADLSPVYSAAGKLDFLESHGDRLSMIVREQDSSYTLRQLQLPGGDLVERQAILLLKQLRNGYDFSFLDYNIDANLVAFVEYTVPGSLFGSPKLWLYDLEQEVYTEPQPIRGSKGNIYGLKLSYGLCRQLID